MGAAAALLLSGCINATGDATSPPPQQEAPANGQGAELYEISQEQREQQKRATAILGISEKSTGNTIWMNNCVATAIEIDYRNYFVTTPRCVNNARNPSDFSKVNSENSATNIELLTDVSLVISTPDGPASDNPSEMAVVKRVVAENDPNGLALLDIKPFIEAKREFKNLLPINHQLFAAPNNPPKTGEETALYPLQPNGEEVRAVYAGSWNNNTLVAVEPQPGQADPCHAGLQGSVVIFRDGRYSGPSNYSLAPHPLSRGEAEAATGTDISHAPQGYSSVCTFGIIDPDKLKEMTELINNPVKP